MRTAAASTVTARVARRLGTGGRGALVAALAGCWGGHALPSGQTDAANCPPVVERPAAPLVTAPETVAPPPSQVLVLGTPHLRVLDAPPSPDAIGPVLDLLAGFRPDLIGVESMPAWLIADLERNAPEFDAALRYFAADRLRHGHAAQRATGLSRAEAAASAEARLAAVGEPGAAVNDRPTLVLLLLAAYELDTALLHWFLVPPAERAAPGPFPPDIATFLDRELTRSNEKIALALALAHRLGHQRIWAIDDDHEAAHLARVGQLLQPAMQENALLKAAAESPFYRDSEQELRSLAAAGESLLPYYEKVNSAAYARTDIDTQFTVFLRSRLPSGADRMRLGLWDTRNLRITAHIREALALAPGRRMLVIIGAAHKPFLDRYLAEMADVEVVQFAGLACRARAAE